MMARCWNQCRWYLSERPGQKDRWPGNLEAGTERANSREYADGYPTPRKKTVLEKVEQAQIAVENVFNGFSSGMVGVMMAITTGQDI